MAYALVPRNGGPTIALDREVVVIGRSPRCDVILDQTKFVSRRHCRFITAADRVILSDLGSMNGVYVNNRRMGPYLVLQPGDRVRIGGVKFVLDDGTSASPRKGGQPRPTLPAPDDAPLWFRIARAQRDGSDDGPTEKTETEKETRNRPPGREIDFSPLVEESRPETTPPKRTKRLPRVRLNEDHPLKPLPSSELATEPAPAKTKKRTSKAPKKQVRRQPQSIPPPSSMFLRTDWKTLEQMGNTVQSVKLGCPKCRKEFEWTAEKSKKGIWSLTPGVCPRCSRDIAPMSNEGIGRLLKMEDNDPERDDFEDRDFQTAKTRGTVRLRRRAVGGWDGVAQSVGMTFLATLTMAFVLTLVWMVPVLRLIAHLAPSVGETFIPFGSGAVRLQGYELVGAGVAMCGAAALPMILIWAVRTVADELSLIAMAGVAGGLIAAALTGESSILSATLMTQIATFALAIAAGACGVFSLAFWRMPEADNYRGQELALTAGSFVAALSLLWLAVEMNETRVPLLGPVPSLAIARMLLPAAAAASAAIGMMGWILIGIATFLRDEQTRNSIRDFLVYHSATTVGGVIALSVVVAEPPGSSLAIGATFIAGLAIAVDLFWATVTVGAFRYLLR